MSETEAERGSGSTGEDVARAVRAEIERIVPGEPLQPQTSRTRESRMASESSYNGQYRALETRVEDLRGNYHDLRNDMDTRFSALSGEVAKLGADMSTRFDRLVELQNNGRGDLTKYGTVIGIAAAVLTSIIGGFVKLENDSITGSIADLKTVFSKDVVRIEKRLDANDAAFVGRPELAGWKTDLANVQAELRRTQDEHTKTMANLVSDVAYIKGDVERFKGIAVSRSEIDGNKAEITNRLNLLSNRVTDLAKDLSSVPIMLETQRQIRADLTELTRKVYIPAYGPQK